MKTVKCTLVGDPGVGKASLLRTFTSGEFPEEVEPIIFDTFLTHISVDGKSCQMSLWYTNGMEEFNRFRPLSYPGSNIVLICFSIEFRSSFNNVVEKWAPEIKEHCPDIPVILVGLKQDLRHSVKEDRGTLYANINDNEDDNKNKNESKKKEAEGEIFITPFEATQLANKLGFVNYIEVSSVTKHNLQMLFDEAATHSTTTAEMPDTEKPKNVLQHCKGCIIS